MCAMSHWCVWHDACLYVTWRTHTCDVTLVGSWKNLFTWVTWLNHKCDMTYWYVWHDSSICVWETLVIATKHSTTATHCNTANSTRFVPRTIQMCDMTHSSVWHESFILYEKSLRFQRHIQQNKWDDSFIFVTWPGHVCGTTHSYICGRRLRFLRQTPQNVWHASFMCITWRSHVYGMTHSYVYENPLCFRRDIQWNM